MHRLRLPGLLFQTVRHLKREQLTGRLRHAWRHRLENPGRFANRPVPPFPGVRTCTGHPLPAAVFPRWDESELRAGRFRFLNMEKELGFPPDWRFRDAPLLWQYQLHYFDYIRHLAPDTAEILVMDWIRNYPLERGLPGWDSYPISMRLMNWVAVFRNHPGTLKTLWPSMFLQAEWLQAHLEFHLLGNHLLENAAALTVMGSVFQGPDAEIWRETGKNLLLRELPEQVPPDGMHFEKSPMYHGRLVIMLLEILAVCDAMTRGWLEPLLARCVIPFRLMRHPDNGIALFNDSAHGMVMNAAGLAKLLNTICPQDDPAAGPFALKDAGYYGSHDPEGNTIICDAGSVGPEYIPGHAHGDIFSFEMSLRGCRVIVDSGVHDYETGDLRRYCRSTRAHNTVEIDGRDQCRFWGAFRVAERGRPFHVKWTPLSDGFNLEGEHDGYLHRRPGAVHYRRFQWRRPGILTLTDTIQSGSPVTAVSRFHLHPDCRIVAMSADTARIAFPHGEFTITFSGEGVLDRESALYCPRFGERLENIAVTYTVRQSRSRFRTRISLTG